MTAHVATGSSLHRAPGEYGGNVWDMATTLRARRYYPVRTEPNRHSVRVPPRRAQSPSRDGALVPRPGQLATVGSSVSLP